MHDETSTAGSDSEMGDISLSEDEGAVANNDAMDKTSRCPGNSLQVQLSKK
jgi:hypothetical protein